MNDIFYQIHILIYILENKQNFISAWNSFSLQNWESQPESAAKKQNKTNKKICEVRKLNPATNSVLHDYRPDLLAFLHECSLTWLRPFQDGGRGKAGLAKHKLFRRCQIPCCRRQPSRPGMPRKRISGKVVFVTLMIIFKNFDRTFSLFLFIGVRIIS